MLRQCPSPPARRRPAPAAATATSPTCVRDGRTSRGDHRRRQRTPGVREPDRQLTWAELDRDVDAAAAGLRTELHLHAGDRVALALANTPAFVTAYFARAARRAGRRCRSTPATPRRRSPRLLGDADAKAVLCDDATTSPWSRRRWPARTGRVVDPAGFDAVLAGGRGAGAGRGRRAAARTSRCCCSPPAPAAGRAGAMLSHRALLANLDQCAAARARRRCAPDDVVLLVLPLFHVYGLNAGLGMVAATGGHRRAGRALRPARDARRGRGDEGVTNIPGAPPMYVAWAARRPDLDDALRGVRLLASGASPLPPAVLRAGRGRHRASPSTRATA